MRRRRGKGLTLDNHISAKTGAATPRILNFDPLRCAGNPAAPSRGVAPKSVGRTFKPLLPASGAGYTGRHDVSRILSAIDQGDPHAAGQLLPLVYNELRKLAAQKMAQEKPGQTLQPTALVHEAYLRLVDVDEPQRQRWDGRAHFFAVAAEAMRRIVIDNARHKKSLKAGGDRQRVEL